MTISHYKCNVCGESFPVGGNHREYKHRIHISVDGESVEVVVYFKITSLYNSKSADQHYCGDCLFRLLEIVSFEKDIPGGRKIPDPPTPF